MRRRGSCGPALLALAMILGACAPGGAEPTPRFVTPPPLAVAPTVLAPPSPTSSASVAPSPGVTPAAPPSPGVAIAPAGSPPATSRPASASSAPAPSARPPAAGPPTLAPLPTPTASATAAQGPVAAQGPAGSVPRATKLTRDGCCPTPRWLADSSGVAFYGSSAADDPRRGTWAVPREGGTPRLLTEGYGAFSPDGSLVASPAGEVTRLTRLDGTLLGTLINGGRRAYIAATNDRVAWMTPAAGVAIVSPSLDPPFRVSLARLDSGEAVTLPPVFIGETIHWFPDGRRILVAGRDSRAEHPGLWVLDTNSGAATLIVPSAGIESPLISPDGRWIAYTVTLNRDPAANGVWLVNADGGGRQRLPIAGGYRWTPDSRALLYLPVPTENPGDELWRYTLADGARTPLVSVDQAPFAVAQNEWEVAPDGSAIAYRSATDGAIWTLRFAP